MYLSFLYMYYSPAFLNFFPPSFLSLCLLFLSDMLFKFSAKYKKKKNIHTLV